MTAARISLLFNGLFVGLVAALHGLRPDVDPSWRFISEYAVGKYGWLMQAAFVSLAVANVATWRTIRDSLQTKWGKAGSILFLVGTCGLLLAAAFATDPVNTPPELQTTSGKLHSLGGALGLLSFIGTVIFSVRLLCTESWRPVRTAVWIATAILVVGFLISFFGIAALAAANDGVFSPATPVGWPNRIGILGGCLWQAIIVWSAPVGRNKP